jgi:hypothetical protein
MFHGHFLFIVTSRGVVEYCEPSCTIEAKLLKLSLLIQVIAFMWHRTHRLCSLLEQQTVDMSQRRSGWEVTCLWPAGTANAEDQLHFHVLGSRPGQGRRQETDPQSHFRSPLDNSDPEVTWIREATLVAVRLKQDTNPERLETPRVDHPRNGIFLKALRHGLYLGRRIVAVQVTASAVGPGDRHPRSCLDSHRDAIRPRGRALQGQWPLPLLGPTTPQISPGFCP